MAIRRPKNIKINLPKIRFSGFTDLIAKSFKIYFDNFKLVVIYILILDLPQSLLVNFNHHLIFGWLGIFNIGMDICLLIIIFICSSVSWLAFIYAISYAIKNKKNPPFMDALNWGFERCLRFLSWSLLYWLLIGLWSLALVIPGIIVFIRYSLLPVVITLEGGKNGNPLTRSKTIAKGHLIMLFKINLLFFIAPIAIYYFFMSLTGLLSPAPEHFVYSVVADSIVDLITMPYVIMLILAYVFWSQKTHRKVTARRV